jgi:hypothetical protein
MPSRTFHVDGGTVSLNARPDRIDLRDRAYQPALRNLPSQFPSEDLIKSWLPKYASLILDQGQEGACTGFGLAAVVNYLLFRERMLNGTKTPFEKSSPAMLYRLARMYDEWPGEDYEGSSCRGAMKGWHKHGVCSEDLWAHVDGASQPPKSGWDQEAAQLPLGAYFRVEKKSISDIQSAILEVGAVFASADVHNGWKVEKAKTLAGAEIRWKAGMSITGGHAFAIVGYLPEGFIVQNSWGPAWGHHGFAIMSYEDWVANGSDIWVAALGAPMLSARAQRVVIRAGRGGAALLVPGKIGAAATSEEAKANGHPGLWDKEQAYQHSIITENNGRPISRLPEAFTGEQAIQQLVQDRLRPWLNKAGSSGKVLLYAHGGLNSEEASVDRIRTMAPWFEANGVYPIFFTWKTGPVETLFNMLEDLARRIFGTEVPSSLAGDWWDRFKAKSKELAEEAVDRLLEPAMREILVKAAWTDMKQNAARSADPAGGLGILARELGVLKSAGVKFDLHFIGHSAGAILLGELLDILPDHGLTCSSMRLFAPACTVEFAHEHYLDMSTGAPSLKPKKFHIHILDDAQERADTSGPYNKSLLYLICRALEEEHKTPVLGMEAVWNGIYDKKDIFESDMLDEHVKPWRKAMKSAGITPDVWDKAKLVDDGMEQKEPTHGGFDNDRHLLTAAIKSILGKTPPKPVTYLRF